MIPPGTGVVVLAGDQVEVFNNKILNHKTVGVAIINYQITQLPIPVHPGWSPYTKNVFVHNNTYERTTGIPDITKDLGKLITAKCMRAQDLIYDGITDDAVGKDVTKNPMTICIKETSADFRFSRLVLPATGGLMDISVANDVQHFNACGTAVATDVKL